MAIIRQTRHTGAAIDRDSSHPILAQGWIEPSGGIRYLVAYSNEKTTFSMQSFFNYEVLDNGIVRFEPLPGVDQGELF